MTRTASILGLPVAEPRDEVEVTGTREVLAARERTIETLEQRVQQLEGELMAARESLRGMDIELQSLRVPAALPVSESLRAMVAATEPLPPISLPVAHAAPRSLPPASARPSQWKPASPSVGYPVLEHVAIALRASTLPPGADSIPPSQRKSPRRVCEIELEFTEETQFFSGLTQDISEGGVFIATYQLFPIGSRLELSFDLPDGTKVNTWGRVRWLREETPHSRPGMGVEFGELTEDMLRAIQRFCAARPPLYMEV
ncbi:MAG: TIGR02266 family protein [Polyangiaceae bacterium]